MAGAEDVYKIGVEYTGAAAFDQFAGDLNELPLDLQRVMDGLVRAGAQKGVMASAGGAAGKAYVDAVLAATRQGMRLLDDSVFGRSVARGAGLSQYEGGGRAFRSMEQAANRLKNQTLMDTWGRPNRDLQDYVARLQEAERRTRSISTGTYSLLQAQERLQRIPTFAEREARALSNASLSQGAREALARATAQTMAPMASSVVPMRLPFTPDLSGRNAPAQQFVRVLNQNDGSLGAREHFLASAERFGLSPTEARKIAVDYADLGKQIRAEAAAHQAAAEAAAQARRNELERRTTRSRDAVQIAPGDDSWNRGDDPTGALAARQQYAFGSYAENMPQGVRDITRAMDALRQLPVRLEDLGLKPGESTRFGSASAARQQQDFALGSYRANVEATRERERAEAKALADQLPLTLRNLGLASGESTRLGSASASRQQQQFAFGSYRSNLDATREREAADKAAALADERSLRAAERRAVQEERAAQRAQAAASTPQARARAGGFKDQFLYGFGVGDDDRPFGEMVGQTARISLFYGAAYRGLSLLQQGLSMAVQETLAYEDALTNLNVVTGRARTENEALASRLGDISTSAGFSPSQGVALGAQAVGLYGVANASRDDQERAVELSTRVATQMARVSGADATLTQTQLAGALRSLGWGIERLPELQDTISFISRQTGQAPTELLGAVANISTLGTQAGFSPQQLAALVAQVGTTTGQNPEATSGQFRQVLSVNASTVAAKASDIVGVDLSGLDLQQIFATVSQLSLSTDQLNRFASLFGKGGSQQVATILTQQYGTVQSLATNAQSADGFGAEAFERSMAAIGNQLREFGAEFVGLGVKLVESGVVDWLALVVAALQNVVSVGNDLLDVFNQMPRWMRSTALALAEVYAAAALYQKLTTGSAAGAGGRAARASEAVVRAGGMLAAGDVKGLGDAVAKGLSSTFGQGGALRLVGGRGAVVDPRISSNPLLGRAQISTGLTTAGLGLAAGGALWLGSQVGSAVGASQRADRMVDENRSAVLGAQTAKELDDVAAGARNAAAELEALTLSGLRPGDATSLPSALINQFSLRGEIDELRALDDQASRRAAAMETARDSATLDSDRYFGGNFSAEGLAAGVEAMSAAGLTASQRMDILNDALDRLSAGATATAGAVAVLVDAQIPYASALLAGGVGGAVSEAGQYALNERDSIRLGHQANDGLAGLLTGRLTGSSQDASYDALNLSAEDQKALDERMNRAFQALIPAVLGDGIIDQEEVTRLTEEAINQVGSQIDMDALDPKTQNALRVLIGSRIQNILRQFSPEAISADPTAYVDLAMASAEDTASRSALYGGSAAGVARGRLADLQASRQTLLSQISASGEPMTGDQVNALRSLNDAIRSAENDYVDAQLGRVDALLALAQSNLATDDVTGRLAATREALLQKLEILRAQMVQDMAAAASEAMHGGNPTPVDTSAFDAVLASLRGNEQEGANNALRIRQSQRLAGVWGGDGVGNAAVQIANARDALASATPGEVAWWDARQALNQAQYSYSQAVVSRQNAAASAAIAGNRSELAQAQVSIQNAQRLLAAQMAGTEPYYNALAQLRSAQEGLAAAELAQADRVRRLNSDLTDPVEQALLDVRKAQEQLARDRASGQGTDVIAQDQLDLRSAENAAEQAAFNQRLSDVQINEQLGRITHQQYMNYLQSEHDRLTAIADRTRQQQDQLNQVDQLMKAAAEELQGQWNIGNIELPTVYEVRRSMQSGQAGRVSDYSHSNNVAYINGVDFAAVVEWLQNNLGQGAQVVTAYGNRRS